MTWTRGIGWPRHILRLQCLSVDGTKARSIRPFLYDAVRCLYNPRHRANCNTLGVTPEEADRIMHPALAALAGKIGHNLPLIQFVTRTLYCACRSRATHTARTEIPLGKTSKAMTRKNPKSSNVKLKLIQSMIRCIDVTPRRHTLPDPTTVGSLLEIRTLVTRSGIAPFERL